MSYINMIPSYDEENYGIYEIYRNIIEIIPIIQKKGLEALIRTQKTNVYNEERFRRKARTYQQIFRLLQNKWSLELCYALMMYKTCGYNDLMRILSGISSRTLTDKLFFLEKKKYISRIVQNERPIRVNYQLTEKGKQAFLLLMPFLVYNLLPLKIRKKFPKIESIEEEFNIFESQKVEKFQNIE